MMPEAPKKDDAGHLVARFDIIDTPMGKIAAALAKYGFKFGISSRGTGDTYMDYDGNESVDADTYDFQAFDLVLLPACEDARLKLAESFDVKKIKFRKELKEALETATEEQRKLLTDTLNNLDIDYSPEKGSNKNADTDTDTAAEDNGANMLKDLQESIRIQRELEDTVKSLQEKLSVCYTKETRYAEKLTKVQNELTSERVKSKQLSEEVGSLKESLEQSNETIKKFREKVASMRNTATTTKGEVTSLTESLSTKDKEITKIKGELKTLKENYTKRCNELTTTNEQLQESLKESQKDCQIVKSQSTAKLTKASSLVEKYKAIAHTAIDKYISSQAMRLGVSADEIKKQLKENYSFNDIDRVCEGLQRYKLNVNSLPFSVRGRSGMKMTITESKETITPIDDSKLVDDDVDESLLNIIK
jgi:DNA repair exonuclease SbcCD ATPase subunit